MFFLSHCCQEFFHSLGVTVHLTSLGCPPTLCWSLDLLWWAAQILIWPYSYVFLPLMSTAIRTTVFSFVGTLYDLFIFHWHRICLVDCVDLIRSLYSWWEGFRSSSLATLPLGFNCGFISTSAWGSSTGVCSWGCPGGLGCGGVAAAWVAGVLAAPGTQGSWWLEQQEI